MQLQFGAAFFCHVCVCVRSSHVFNTLLEDVQRFRRSKFVSRSTFDQKLCSVLYITMYTYHVGFLDMQRITVRNPQMSAHLIGMFQMFNK